MLQCCQLGEIKTKKLSNFSSQAEQEKYCMSLIFGIQKDKLRETVCRVLVTGAGAGGNGRFDKNNFIKGYNSVIRLTSLVM